MNFILNTISVVSSIIFGVGIIYLILSYSLGRFIKSNKTIFNIEAKEFIFMATAVIVLFYFFNIYVPY